MIIVELQQIIIFWLDPTIYIPNSFQSSALECIQGLSNIKKSKFKGLMLNKKDERCLKR